MSLRTNQRGTLVVAISIVLLLRCQWSTTIKKCDKHNLHTKLVAIEIDGSVNNLLFSSKSSSQTYIKQAQSPGCISSVLEKRWSSAAAFNFVLNLKCFSQFFVSSSCPPRANSVGDFSQAPQPSVQYLIPNGSSSFFNALKTSSFLLPKRVTCPVCQLRAITSADLSLPDKTPHLI